MDALSTRIVFLGSRADPFEVGGVDYDRQRVVRQPGATPKDDTIHALNPPDFSKANTVVAFDVAPTTWMWRIYYGVSFNHKRVFSDDETAEFLQREMDTNVIQTVDSRKPYDEGT
jgi:hypothetical protein